MITDRVATNLLMSIVHDVVAQKVVHDVVALINLASAARIVEVFSFQRDEPVGAFILRHTKHGSHATMHDVR